jgi:hypothetical protein
MNSGQRLLGSNQLQLTWALKSIEMPIDRSGRTDLQKPPHSNSKDG